MRLMKKLKLGSVLCLFSITGCGEYEEVRIGVGGIRNHSQVIAATYDLQVDGDYKGLEIWLKGGGYIRSLGANPKDLADLTVANAPATQVGNFEISCSYEGASSGYNYFVGLIGLMGEPEDGRYSVIDFIEDYQSYVDMLGSMPETFAMPVDTTRAEVGGVWGPDNVCRKTYSDVPNPS